MKVLYIGTPEIAATILDAIIGSRHEVVAVVTQEDKPKGRSKELVMPPVKELAINNNIPVLQPHRIKRPESVEELKKIDADIFVVAAYGQILSREILDIPKYGCIVVHASLLPKYRGAAPIQWAIIDGEKHTGITIIQMDEGIDTGDMLFKSTVEIEDTDTSDILHDKLAKAGAELIVDALDAIEKGDINPVKQDNEYSSYAKILNKADGHIDFDNEAVKIERLVRGLNSWPGTYCFINGKTLKIWEAKVTDDKSNGDPGTIALVKDGRMTVNTSDNQLEILTLQLEGKKRMDTKSFLLGYKVKEGDLLT